jgi:hypothetical protein
MSMFADRSYHPNGDRHREATWTARAGRPQPGTSESLRVDHDPARAGSARVIARCPQCESPMTPSGFCMSCWEVC